jgi:hypothetical protein
MIRTGILVLGLIFFSSCIYHRSFVATPFEPVTVKEKGDVEISATLRPFKYYSLNVTGTPSDFMAVRIGAAGFFGLANYNGSIIFFKDYTRFGIFFAPSVNYQVNKINRFMPGLLYDKKYNYDCEYVSPSIVAGIRLGENRYETHQIILKAQYNIVNKYSYSFTKSESTASSYAHIYDQENVQVKIPDFISLEASYSFLEAIGNNSHLKFQAGINLVQKSFVNSYSFSTIRMGGPLQSSVSRHPKYLGFNIGIGIIFGANLRNSRSPK